MGEAYITRRRCITNIIVGGGNLTVSVPPNATVTVSKDGVSQTKTANSNGSVSFSGLNSGVWTITAVLGSNSKSTTITITADYADVIEYVGVPEFTYTGSY
jgi:uncharacterized GH25 family protein